MEEQDKQRALNRNRGGGRGENGFAGMPRSHADDETQEDGDRRTPEEASRFP